MRLRVALAACLLGAGGRADGGHRSSRRLINEFSLRRGRYTGRQWAYEMEAPGNSIVDFTQLDGDRFLAIERDQNQGPTAALKEIFEVDLGHVDRNGYLVERPGVDLLHIADPFGSSLPAHPLAAGRLRVRDPGARSPVGETIRAASARRRSDLR